MSATLAPPTALPLPRTSAPVSRDTTGSDPADLASTILVKSLAHDLRTPLAVVLTALELLSTRGGETPTITVERLLELATGAAGRIGRMIDSLGDTGPDDHPAPFQQVARAAVREVELATAGRIELDMAHDLPLVQGADTHLRVLVNLIGNAVKFGGAASPVHVLVTHHDGEVTVEVADRGPGIPAADLERVLEPGVRLAGDDVPGSGLGLSIVRRLVEELGGTLRISSTPGRGTTITYTTPVATTIIDI